MQKILNIDQHISNPIKTLGLHSFSQTKEFLTKSKERPVQKAMTTPAKAYIAKLALKFVTKIPKFLKEQFADH